MKRFLPDQNPSIARVILEKITQAAMARDVARKARDSVREKSALNFQAYRENLQIAKFKKERGLNYLLLRETPLVGLLNKEELESIKQFYP